MERRLITVEQARKRRLEHSSVGAIIEVMVFMRIMEDALTEFQNDEVVRKWRYECKGIEAQLEQIRKRTRRGTDKADADAMEDMVCEIADEVEERLQKIRQKVREELMQKIPWDKIRVAELIALMGLSMQAVQSISVAMQWKRKSEFDECYRYLKMIDEGISFLPLNKWQEKPDFKKAMAEAEALIEALPAIIKEKCREKTIDKE